MVLWRHRRQRWNERWTPWSQLFAAQAECIHRHESIRWNEPSLGPDDPGGGMQFKPPTWIAHGGGRWASSAEFALPHVQILVAWFTWRDDGDSWQEWSTRYFCT